MSQMVWIEPSHSKPEFEEEESFRCRLEDRQGRRLTSRRRLVSNLIVLIKRCDKAILQLGYMYFISNLEQHTLDESKVDSAAVTLRIRLASIRHVLRVIGTSPTKEHSEKESTKRPKPLTTIS